jgi:hypothetical protein
MLRGTGRELTNQRSKMRVLQAPGYTRTYTGRKAILRMPRIGTSVRASLRAAVRFERSGLRLQKLSSANVTARGNLAVSSMVEKHGNLMPWFNEQAQKAIGVNPEGGQV